jgi:hypothetical protein
MGGTPRRTPLVWWPVVRGRWRILAAPGVAALAALALAGCGGTRVDAHETKGTYDVEIVHATFPTKQVIAKPATLTIAVRNSSGKTIPTLAVTVDSFNYTSDAPELAANKRPIWAIERGPGAVARPPVQSVEVSTPGSGQTAYVNTWALGALAAGRTRTFSWNVVPVKAGAHTVRFAVAAGLSGKAKAELANGGPANGHFDVAIAAAPPLTFVDPSTGKVRRGKRPTTP